MRMRAATTLLRALGHACGRRPSASPSHLQPAQQRLLPALASTPQEGHQKKELAFPSAAAMAGMAALCLWRGFRKEDE